MVRRALISGSVFRPEGDIVVHDINPSDRWMHDTDSVLSKIHDTAVLRGWNVDEFNRHHRDLLAKYREALIIDEHRASSGIITAFEMGKTREWFDQGNSLIDRIYGSFTQFRSMHTKSVSADESEEMESKFVRLLSQLRENIRDRYISDREFERRENAGRS